ncbi:MAG: hypothetical protein NC397_02635 [Clostridium sp.]|nr:hypothetical protein [Clostridium sp.]
MDEEIKEERLDSPLVVHKKDDASYQETASDIDMSATHIDDESEDMPTLERHRFRKEKKSHGGVWVIIALLAVAAAIIGALVYSGVLPLNKQEPTTKVERTYTTEAENKFKGVITIKTTYIFFEGREVDGLQGLEKEIKYLDPGAKFVIEDENADSNFLNLEVLSLLSQYGVDYEITHIVSSGLESKYETTAAKITEAKKEKTKTTSKDADKAES